MSTLVTPTIEVVDAKFLFCQKMAQAGWSIDQSTENYLNNVDLVPEHKNVAIMIEDNLDCSHFTQEIDMNALSWLNGTQQIDMNSETIDDDLSWLNEDEEIEMATAAEASFSHKNAQLGLGYFAQSQSPKGLSSILVFIGCNVHLWEFVRFRFYYRDPCQLEKGLDLIIRSQDSLSTKNYIALISQLLPIGMEVFWDIDGFDGWQVDETNLLEGHPNLEITFK